MKESLEARITQQVAADGMPAKFVELQNSHGMTVSFMDIGATWLSCRLPLPEGELREVLLGVGTMAQFNEHTSYMGATVGRYANRIANGQVSIAGKTYQLSQNQAGNCHHGGSEGFDKRRWAIQHQSLQQVTFTLDSKDGDQGFPGNLTVSVTYSLTEENEVEVVYRATTDKATPIGLTNHAYINLSSQQSDCLTHQLVIDADYYAPTTDKGIPLGMLSTVSETSFDFRVAKPIGDDLLQDDQQRMAKGYDHSYLLNPDRDKSIPVARLVAPDGSVTLSIVTDKPGLQLYTGNWLAGQPCREGGTYDNYAGVALETQFLPDSPNQLEWPQPSCILQPDQEYRYQTTFCFDF
ncbi:galactose-1-epimerase [Vibrio sp. SCSIO 43140]|uniref:galactose-1-epimerase n=1 Tax=Vibrio sp. SCSIO 43140 TaxID=2819100 RepID=UPI002074EFEB|nr:galactose-1-epimerase [Vibrio sp. SCSIO 43140]USD62480.1 galactose-1-epimerase [Vibrio sp. SCSIO 43140]